MDDRNLELMRTWVPDTYVQQGAQSLAARSGRLRSLLTQRRAPEEGWEEDDVEAVLREIAWMDSNHFPGRVGVGEREGRVWSSVVRRRHFGLAHGIGRSGDIAAIQPKAAGSSLLNKLTNTLLCDWLRRCGLRRIRACVLFPLATGMTLSLCMLTLRHQRPQGAKYVIWPRVDQKSCFKSILTAGLEPLVLEPDAEAAATGQELRIPAASVRAAIEAHGADSIVCVMTTTSCFAPRGFDDVEGIASICRELGVPHLVNHAYGVQSSKLCHIVNEAIRVGRVDAVVQSTDKNFLVPVGGAIVASQDADFVDSVSKTYPGRASASPLVDVLATMLQMGTRRMEEIRAAQKRTFRHLQERLREWAGRHDEELIETPHNPISCAVTLRTLPTIQGKENPSYFGAMLFTRGVSGARVVAPGTSKAIGPFEFRNYGSHTNVYPCAYFTAAAALGLTSADVDTFIDKLEAAYAAFCRQAGTPAADTCDGDGDDGAAGASYPDVD